MTTTDSQHFANKAERCFRLARVADGEAARRELASELDVLGHEFLKKAVDIKIDCSESEKAN